MKYDDFGYRFSSGELMGSEDLCLAGAWWERNCMETLSQGAFSACGVVRICRCWRPSEDEDEDGDDSK